MEIIIEGHKVDTKDIWDIKLDSDAYGIWIKVKITDKPEIVIGRKIPYDSSRMTVYEYKVPYEKLYKSIKEKWEADKADIPIFKL